MLRPTEPQTKALRSQRHFSLGRSSADTKLLRKHWWICKWAVWGLYGLGCFWKEKAWFKQASVIREIYGLIELRGLEAGLWSPDPEAVFQFFPTLKATCCFLQSLASHGPEMAATRFQGRRLLSAGEKVTLSHHSTKCPEDSADWPVGFVTLWSPHCGQETDCIIWINLYSPGQPQG